MSLDNLILIFKYEVFQVGSGSDLVLVDCSHITHQRHEMDVKWPPYQPHVITITVHKRNLHDTKNRLNKHPKTAPITVQNDFTMLQNLKSLCMYGFLELFRHPI